MEILIRDMTIEDCGDICQLMNSHLKFGLDVEPTVLSRQIEKMKVNGNYFLRVAVYRNKIVGFVAAYKALLLEMSDEYMRIIGLATNADYRRKGIGKRLIDEVSQYASQNGAAYIALNTIPKAKDDHAFFEAIGFERKSVCYSKICNTERNR